MGELTFTFLLLHCKHPAFDFLCDRRPGAAESIFVSTFKQGLNGSRYPNWPRELPVP